MNLPFPPLLFSLLMDVNTPIIAASMAEGVDQNGDFEDTPIQGKECIAADLADEILQAVQVTLTNPSTLAVNEHAELHEENNYLPASRAQEMGEEDNHQEKNCDRQIGPDKAKAGKPLSSKISVQVWVKKPDSVKALKAGSNGALSSSVRPKQSFPKGSSFDDGQISSCNAKMVMKSGTATGNAQKPKPTQRTASDLLNATEDAAQSDVPVVKSKVDPSKGPQHIAEGNSESILSPRSEDSRTRRLGKLPSYGFNFRCNERAERRREFHSKLEEKFQAKEVEITNQEAKSKESQEAEIKMLRKSLNFKATPMPSFYQEPSAPKLELKKIPTTRPRSPKLGRKKSSSSLEGEGDGNGNHNNQPGRLSLGAKVPKAKPSEGTSPVHPQKPQRKSLPRLASEKTSLPSKAAKDVAKTTTPAAQTEADETPRDPEPYQAPFVSEIESDDVVEEGKGAQPISSKQKTFTVTVAN